jgi:hypothetical protein
MHRCMVTGCLGNGTHRYSGTVLCHEHAAQIEGEHG